jgi:hypothetical protein
MLFNKIVRLPAEDSGLSLSIVRFYNGLIDSKKRDKTKFFRRQMVVIVNKDNGNKILRYAMGSASLSIKKQSLAIDYDGLDALALKAKAECNLKVYKANMFEVITWYYNHTDMNVQLSTRLGLLGAALGVMGFTISLVSFI